MWSLVYVYNNISYYTSRNLTSLACYERKDCIFHTSFCQSPMLLNLKFLLFFSFFSWEHAIHSNLTILVLLRVVNNSFFLNWFLSRRRQTSLRRPSCLCENSSLDGETISLFVGDAYVGWEETTLVPRDIR